MFKRTKSNHISVRAGEDIPLNVRAPSVKATCAWRPEIGYIYRANTSISLSAQRGERTCGFVTLRSNYSCLHSWRCQTKPGGPKEELQRGALRNLTLALARTPSATEVIVELLFFFGLHCRFTFFFFQIIREKLA